MKTSVVMTFDEALRATGGSLIRGEAEKIFQGVSTDSRTLQDGNLFVCLRGENFDGHRFLAAAAGAAGFVIQKDAGEQIMAAHEQRPVIVVEDTLVALGAIARFWRRKLKVPVIAVTGSSGKTTTKEMTAQILGDTKNVLKTEGNFNNRIGLPLTLLRIADRHDVAVVEMGTNMPGEIECLTRIAEPDIGLITNIGAAHLEKLKSLAGIREEKGALFANMSGDGIAVINRDDTAVEILGRRWQGKRITFGWKRGADVSAGDVRKAGPVGIAFQLRTGRDQRQVQMQVRGIHNLYNALGAAAASLALGGDLDRICRGLESFRGIPGRFDVQILKNGAYVIDDTYNANPLSVREALKTLHELRGAADSVVILGDMLELGTRAGQWHRKIGRVIAETGVQSLLLMGEHGRDTAAGAMERGMPAARIFLCENPGQVQDYLKISLRPGDWVLVKGSRRMKMERIVGMLIETFGLQERAAA
jgi:UDP-N-acetylmuramoyl-tripeptide--D-alanyl-D-alanine ligase